MRPHRDRLRATVALGLWLAFLVTAVVALHGVGGGLAPPPLTDPRAMGRWLDQRQPPEAAVAVLRLVAVGMAWYLLAATVVSVVARLSRIAEAVRLADVFTLPVVRHLANASAGLSVAAGLSAAIGVATSSPDRSPPPRAEVMALLSERCAAVGGSTLTVRNLDGPGTDTTTPAPTTSDGAVEPLPTLRRLPDEPAVPPPQAASSEATPAPSPSSPPSPPLAEAPSPAPGAPPSPARWEVQPGEHFWSVAERVMAAAWHLPAPDAEIDRYWRRLIEVNRAILRDPANPDLLYPGQVLTIPPPPPPPSEHPNP